MKTYYGLLVLTIAFALIFHSATAVQAQDNGSSEISWLAGTDEDQDGPSGITSTPSDDEDQDGAAGIISDPSSDEEQDGAPGIVSDPSTDSEQDASSIPPQSSNESVSSVSQSSNTGSRSRAGTNSVGVIGQGQVLGATASCGIYLSTPLSYYSGKNDPKSVEKLQAFLNENLGTEVPLNGVFDKSTLAAVKKFQLIHKDIIIDPWIKNGKNPRGIATGYVGSTTLWMINNLVCPSLQLPKPVI